MQELPKTPSKDIIPYAKLNRITWYFFGISVSVRLGTLSVPFIISVSVVVIGEVVEKSLLEYNGTVVLVNNENVIESI